MDRFAELVDEAARKEGLSDYQLSHAIGLLPNRKVVDAKQVARLRRGEQRTYPRALVTRLIEILPGLQDREEEVWHAAGVWPRDLTIEGYRRFRTQAHEEISTMRRPSWGFTGIVADLPEAA